MHPAASSMATACAQRREHGRGTARPIYPESARYRNNQAPRTCRPRHSAMRSVGGAASRLDNPFDAELLARIASSLDYRPPRSPRRRATIRRLPLLALVLTTAACSVTTFTQRVSVGSSGVESNGYSAEPVLSADGSLVAFQSLATTLVTGDANGVWDVYVRDRAAGTTERVSVREYPLDGSLEFKGASELPAISSSGSLVAYVSGDVRLPYYPYRQVALNERSTGKDAEVSWQYPVPNPGGGGWNQGEGNNESLRPSVSADGLTVAYESIATDLVKSDKNGRQDIFVTTCSYYVSADCAGYHTERVSVGAAGAEANGDSDFPAISGDGRFVAFDSVATNLVVGDTNTGFDTFVRDRTAGTIERVDLTPSGGQATGATIFTMPAISADGRFVAFASDAPDLVANDTNGERDIFVRDRTSGTTERVSVDSSGA